MSWKLKEASRESGGLPYPLIPMLKTIILVMPVTLGMQGVAHAAAFAAYPAGTADMEWVAGLLFLLRHPVLCWRVFPLPSRSVASPCCLQVLAC